MVGWLVDCQEVKELELMSLPKWIGSRADGPPDKQIPNPFQQSKQFE